MPNTKTLLLSMVMMLTSISATSMSYVGSGVDESLAQAKQLALADLQQNLWVTVETQTHVTRSTDHNDFYRLSSKVSSQLQLLGAENDCLEFNKEHHCTAALSDKQAKLYRAKIERLIRQINDNWRLANKSYGQDKVEALNKLLLLLEQYKALIIVYDLLAPTVPVAETEIRESQVRSAIAKIQNQPANIDELAIAIATPLNKFKRIYVKPFTPLEALEVTPFSRALRAKVISHIDAIVDRDYAFYELSGNYSYNPKMLNIQSHLIALVREKRGQIVQASSQQLPVHSISNLAYKTESEAFDKQLVSQQIIGKQFTVQLKTNLGSRDLVFEPPTPVKLYIKLNQPGYFYLVGHSKNAVVSQSYLLDLNDAKDQQKFIHYLGVEQINRWVEVAEFDVLPPYGKESIQAFGALDYPESILPTTQFDGTYYKIAGSFKEVAMKTRGLVRRNRLIQNAKSNSAIIKEPSAVTDRNSDQSSDINNKAANKLTTDQPDSLNVANYNANEVVHSSNDAVKSDKRNAIIINHNSKQNRVAEAVLTFTTFGSKSQ